MFLMMAFLLASMLLLAVMVLALTFHLSKGKHLCKTSSSSHSKKRQLDSPVNINSFCQTCPLCGGLRLRSSSASSFGGSKGSKSNVHRAGQSRPTRNQWAAMKAHIIPNVKQAIQKLISHHKGQAHIYFSTKLASLSNFSKQKTNSKSRDISVLPAASLKPKCSSYDSIISRSSSSLDGKVSNADMGAARSEFDNMSSPDTQRSTEVNPQSTAIHRVFLEILVSPSGNSEESGCTIRPGLTVRLESGGTLEHLAGCIEALNDKDALNCEGNAEITHVSCRANNVLPKTTGSGGACGDQASQMLSGIPKEVPLSPKDEIDFSDLISLKMEAVGGGPQLDSIALNKYSQALAGPRDRVGCSYLMGHNMERESPKVTAFVAEDHFASNGQCGNHLCESSLSDMTMQHTSEDKIGSDSASGEPLCNIGSLHISILKHKGQEGVSDINGAVGSTLASLNVTEDKIVGGIGSNCMKKEKLNGKWSALSEDSCSSKCVSIGVPEAEHFCVNEVTKEEVCLASHASADAALKDNFSLSFRKGKKKKKNRCKKLKGSTESSVVNAKEMQKIGKIALEAAKHVSPVPERELGCVCGALKGNAHTESCPYPFTSSGSMFQKKMKEQYNHLVNSNAAKTLTLAQVGQFTSCLLEAKATLRQKSESIQRKFTITKSLLSKADKSSFDRLCGQIYSLEMEQKKLEEDTVVYNRLQEQLKLSPAFQKMLEYGRAHFELQPHTGQMIEKLEPEESEISFEEFLAQEKKDAFWQKHSLARSSLSAS